MVLGRVEVVGAISGTEMTEAPSACDLGLSFACPGAGTRAGGVPHDDNANTSDPSVITARIREVLNGRLICRPEGAVDRGETAGMGTEQRRGPRPNRFRSERGFRSEQLAGSRDPGQVRPSASAWWPTTAQCAHHDPGSHDPLRSLARAIRPAHPQRAACGWA